MLTWTTATPVNSPNQLPNSAMKDKKEYENLECVDTTVDGRLKMNVRFDCDSYRVNSVKIADSNSISLLTILHGSAYVEISSKVFAFMRDFVAFSTDKQVKF